MKKKVVVLGVGALGSHVVQILRNEAITLHVVDFDKVERKNIMSQFFGKASVGKSKAQSLQQLMSFLFERPIEATPHRLTADNVKQVLGGADLLIDCFDNAASRALVQAFAKENNIPCLHGALDDAGTFGRVVWTESFKIDQEPSEGAGTCEDGQFLPHIAVVAAYLARAAQRFLRTGKREGFSINPAGAIST